MTIENTSDKLPTTPAITYGECYAQVFLGDCLIESEKIETGSVDLILTDLPYGNMKKAPTGWDSENLQWDITIEPKKVYEIANRILRKNGKMVLFSQEPYTTQLINEANANLSFNYRAIWEKDNFANALGSNKNMVSFYEDILVYTQNYDKYDPHPLRNYFLDVYNKYGFDFIYDLFKKEGRYSSEDSARANVANKFGTNKTNFEFMNKSLFEFLLQNGLNFNCTYEHLKFKNEEYKLKTQSTFNLWEGNKYKSNILKYKKDYDGYHPTQKPVLLLEDLIKTFSNEGNLVVDLTMGSGSTGVACKNTNRSFIGIEKDENYFKIAEQRINARTLL